MSSPECRYGLQTHFNAPLGADRCRQIRALGVQMARIDAQACSIETMIAMIAEALEAGLVPLVIVSDVEKLQALIADLDVEWTNEPDGDIDPVVYRRGLDAACAVALERGLRLWAPALSNLDEDSLAWANAVRDAGGGWPEGMFGVSVHRYGSDTNVERPHRGFASRDNEVDRWLFALRQGKPFLVSEFGWGTFDLSEDEAAARIAWEWAFWQRHEAYAAFLYQVNDGHGEGERFGVFRVDGTLKAAIAATIPKPDPLVVDEPTDPVEPPQTPAPSFPVPPMGIDLTSWSRRHGCSHGAGLLDARWDYKTFAPLMAGIFGGKWQTRVNVLSASWRETSPHFVWPFTKLPDGRFDLYRWNPAFFEDRLPRFIEWHNRYGGVPVLTFLNLYDWSGRKDVSADHDQDLDWPRNNVNDDVHWEKADTTLYRLPDAFVTELIERTLTVAKQVGIVAVEPANEFPEKPVHFKIAAIVKRLWPECRVQVNRNEDTPGQYQNMQVGQGVVDAIAFHGWKDLGFLTRDFDREPADRPRTFRQFFDNESQDGRSIGVDFSRVVCSSDGARSSSAFPVEHYNRPELLKVFRFVDDKGGSCEHQSRSKMFDGARVEMVETDFLAQVAVR